MLDALLEAGSTATEELEAEEAFDERDELLRLLIGPPETLLECAKLDDDMLNAELLSSEVATDELLFKLLLNGLLLNELLPSELLMGVWLLMALVEDGVELSPPPPPQAANNVTQQHHVACLMLVIPNLVI